MNTSRNTDTLVLVIETNRRWSLRRKLRWFGAPTSRGMTMSLTPHQEGMSTSLLRRWRKLERQGALTVVSAGEAVVPVVEPCVHLVKAKMPDQQPLRCKAEEAAQQIWSRLPKYEHDLDRLRFLKHFGHRPVICPPCRSQYNNLYVNRWVK